ncbi:isoprenoid synthase domain-containing protein [Xylaria telfairii]|nr:isoprenoid synthase domain-containing protein [Xylaria telfairii]
MMIATTIDQTDTALSPSLVDKRGQLLLNLRGRTARIPDLRPIFEGWKGIHHHHISPYVGHLRKTVNERIQSLNFSDSKQELLEQADFGLFTALWWPEASFERIQILAYLVIWIFTWDDEIDEPTGAYSESFSDAQTYRAQTLHFVETCMGLSEISSDNNSLSCRQNGLVESFGVIGSALRNCYDISQRRRFRDEIARFMDASEAEQRGRLNGEVPTIEEYWAFRMGTIAAYIASAAGEYSMGAHLPQELMDSKAMRALWDETNVITSITNDLLSLGKEISLGCIDSIVPLTFASTNDLHEAVLLSVEALSASKQRFDEAAVALLAETRETDGTYKEVLDFIEVQRSNCVGNLIWSLETQRYNVSRVDTKDQSLEFTL